MWSEPRDIRQSYAAHWSRFPSLFLCGSCWLLCLPRTIAVARSMGDCMLDWRFIVRWTSFDWIIAVVANRNFRQRICLFAVRSEKLCFTGNRIEKSGGAGWGWGDERTRVACIIEKAIGIALLIISLSHSLAARERPIRIRRFPLDAQFHRISCTIFFVRCFYPPVVQ